MQKKMLIAVDESNHSRYALAYIARLASPGRDIRCTLFNVQPIISQYLLDEARSNPKVNTTIKMVMEQNKAHSNALLEKCKEFMVREGADAGSIDTVSQTRLLGLSKDIIEYAYKNLYDAIVAGRRGLSRLQKVFMGSVSAKLVEHSSGIPVWIVDGDIRPSQFLIAVDHSDVALQIVDYICGMCAGMSDLRLRFFHVPQSSKELGIEPVVSVSAEADELIAISESRMLESFWPEARRRLAAADIKEDQLDLISPQKTSKVGKMIIETAEKENCDTVIMGRRGSNQAYYFGSVSRYVTERLTDRTVWIIG